MEMDVINRINKQVTDNNIKGAIADLQKLNICFGELVGLLHEHKIQLPHKWYEYYETMGIKFRLNIDSIIELYVVEDNLPKGLIYHDLSSIYLLSRSLLETYLTFYYCYVLPKSEEEGLMNYLIFKISGLVQRQNYGKDDPAPMNSERIALRESERLAIEKYQKELLSLSIFQSLPIKKNEKNNLVAGKYAKRFSFIELIKLSELKNILFCDMWRLYSNYAHCELIGLLQINSYADDTNSIDSALYGTLNNALIIVSLMIKDFTSVFRNTGFDNIDIPAMDEEVMTLIQFWYLMGTDN